MRVLDLGCGAGRCPVRAKVSDNNDVVGVDIDEPRLAIARQSFPNRTFQYARGEALPFPDASFDRVVSAVALPYMDIPKTLAEVRRVLVPGGTVFFSVHAFVLPSASFARPFPGPLLCSIDCSSCSTGCGST